MIVWGCMIIPLVTACILYFGFKRKVVWWEILLPMGVSLLLVSLSKVLISYGQTRDTEYLTTWADHAEYWEDWSELVIRTRTVGSGKNARTETYTEVVYHGPEWYVVDPKGYSRSISSGTFNRLCGQFGDKRFESVFRFGIIVKSGGKYLSKWNGQDSSMEVVSFSSSYENRVQASPTIFGHRKISKAEKAQYQLFEYPDIHELNQKMLLGVDDPVAERTLSLWNAKLGAPHQIRIWLLVFHDQPVDAAFAQESYWSGGNKNELVLCVGLEGNKVSWGYVFSWTEKEGFKAAVKGEIEEQLEQPLNAYKLVEDTVKLIPEGWERKKFKDFDYLSVEPPTWAIILVYLLTLFTNLGIGIWVVTNEFEVKP